MGVCHEAPHRHPVSLFLALVHRRHTQLATVRDPNVLRHPPNAFMLYRIDMSQKLMQQDGRQGRLQVDYSKEIGPMGEDERVKADHNPTDGAQRAH